MPFRFDPVTGIRQYYPLTNVTPFTYRDGETYQSLLNKVVTKTNETLESQNQLGEDVAEEVQHVNDSLDGFRDEFDEMKEETEQWAANTEILQDQAVSSLVTDPNSATNAALSAVNDPIVAALIEDPDSDTNESLITASDSIVSTLIDDPDSDIYASLTTANDSIVSTLIEDTNSGTRASLNTVSDSIVSNLIDDANSSTTEKLDAKYLNDVTSVNEKTGAVVLSASDVGAMSSSDVEDRIDQALSDVPRGANLIDTIRYPLYIAHRGSMHVYPEHSIEGYRASYEAGFSPEADVRALADGTLVCIHDATTNRTMNISKSVSAVTVDEWRKATINPPVNGHIRGVGRGTPVFFSDYLDEFGGKIILFPEIKTPEITQDVINAIVDRGLQRSVIVQSSDFSVVQQIEAAGLTSLFLGTTTTPSDLQAAGVKFVSVPASASQSFIDDCVARDIVVIGYTFNTKQTADAQLARGMSGVFSDDPWFTSRLFTPMKSVDLSRGFIPPASQFMQQKSSLPGNGTQKAVIGGDAIRYDNAETTSNSGNYLLGQFGFEVEKGVTSVKIYLTAQSIAKNGTASDTGWMFGVYLGKQTGDVAVNEEENDSMWRLAMVRRNGQKNAYQKRTLTGSVENLASTSVPSNPYAKSDGRSIPMDFEIEFTSTRIRIKNLTLNDTDLSATHSSLIIPGSYITLSVNAAVGRVYNISMGH